MPALTSPVRDSERKSRAYIKRAPADFYVAEQLDTQFSGSGEHVYFFIEKENLNTLDVAHALAKARGQQVHEVGFAGLKDKHAVTRQWFSQAHATDDFPLQLPGVTCLDVCRHRSKLRRGEHIRNHFSICLRDTTGLDATHLASLAEGFPNYFGSQRVSPSNVAQATDWLVRQDLGPLAKGDATRSASRSRRRRRTSARRGWHLSVLRSLLFNKVLDGRVAQDAIATPVPGDVLIDGVPSGPLWGRGRSATQADALAIETAALTDFAEICAALEYTGVKQARRKLCAWPTDLQVTPLHGTDFKLEFSLESGVFATTMLASMLLVIDEGPGL